MDAAEWDHRYSSSELVWGAGPNRWVEGVCSPLSPGRALDLACGEGRNAIWLARRGWRVTGVDFSEVAVRRAAELAAGAGVSEAASWERADLLGYRPDPIGFDLVVLAYLQLPERQRTAVLRTAAAALATGGTLVVVAHDPLNLTEGVGGPQDPAVLYGADDVQVALGEGPGLAVRRAERVLRPVGDSNSRHAVDALFVATRR